MGSSVSVFSVEGGSMEGWKILLAFDMPEGSVHVLFELPEGKASLVDIEAIIDKIHTVRLTHKEKTCQWSVGEHQWTVFFSDWGHHVFVVWGDEPPASARWRIEDPQCGEIVFYGSPKMGSPTKYVISPNFKKEYILVGDKAK